jgi:metal-responsive CopG/Arc/MetJ family transcriptional regulator
MKNAATTKVNSRLITVWMPHDLIPLLDDAARREDLDRSKFIRRSIRHAITKLPAKEVAK